MWVRRSGAGSTVTAVKTGTADRVLGTAPWPGDPATVQIHLRDHRATPTDAAVANILERVRATGARRVRTGILFPPAADVFARHGFITADSLRLLERGSTADASTDASQRATSQIHQIRNLSLGWWAARSPCGIRAAAEVDQRAFGPTWGYDARAVRAIGTATPLRRARAVCLSRQLAGYLVAGIAAHTGYIQRLAVDPSAQRQGIARALVVDALAWTTDHGVQSVLVNTGIDNIPAQELYLSLGFDVRPELLTIAERDL